MSFFLNCSPACVRPPRKPPRDAALSACLLAMLVLSGCAAVADAPPPALPFEVPGAWSTASPPSVRDAPTLQDWWQRFDDPMLGELVGRALSANATVLTAEVAWRQARALQDVAAAALLPSVGGSASAQHGTSGGNSTGNAYKAGLNGTWVPDVFGLNQSALDAATATAEAAGASVGDARVATAAEVGLAYIGLRGAQARLDIATRNLASQQETLQITQWREQAGLVTALETAQARAAVEQTRAAQPALRTAIEQASHALAVLTGQPPVALASLFAAVAPVPRAEPGLALAIPLHTLRQRADVRVAERKLAAALARVAQARAARMPGFTLGGSIGLSSLLLGTLTDAASVVTSLLASMAVPVFDGGAGLAQVRAQQAAYEQARLAYQAVVLAALKEVEDALIALQEDLLRQASLGIAGEAAAAAYLMARQRYGSGLVDFQVVLETQRTQLSAQDGLAVASADVGSDHVRLYKALGGGWRGAPTNAGALR
jgi:multidrug efflux system outer membrane protein